MLLDGSPEGPAGSREGRGSRIVDNRVRRSEPVSAWYVSHSLRINLPKRIIVAINMHVYEYGKSTSFYCTSNYPIIFMRLYRPSPAPISFISFAFHVYSLFNKHPPLAIPETHCRICDGGNKISKVFLVFTFRDAIWPPVNSHSRH